MVYLVPSMFSREAALAYTLRKMGIYKKKPSLLDPSCGLSQETSQLSISKSS